VQDFVPVPLTLSTAMFVSGQDNRKKEIHIPRGRGEKRLQAALLQYYQQRNTKVIADCLHTRRKDDLLRQILRSKVTNREAKPLAGWDL
jgi:hypothetical protein